jgi:hypothetical protein
MLRFLICSAGKQTTAFCLTTMIGLVKERMQIVIDTIIYIFSLVIVHCYSVCAPDAFHILSLLWLIVYQWFKSCIVNICYGVCLKILELCLSARLNLCSAVNSMCSHCFAIVCCPFQFFA